MPVLKVLLIERNTFLKYFALFRYTKFFFHYAEIFSRATINFCYTYQGFRYIEVRYIRVLLYFEAQCVPNLRN